MDSRSPYPAEESQDVPDGDVEVLNVNMSKDRLSSGCRS